MQTAALLQADPRAANIARQIRAQQKVAAPQGIVVPDSYIDEMARAFVRAYNVDSIADLKSTYVDLTIRGEYDQPAYYALLLTRKDATYIPTHPADDFSQVRGIIDITGGGDPVQAFAVSNDRKLDFGFTWLTELNRPVFMVSPHIEEDYFSFFQAVAPLVLAAVSLNGLPLVIGQAALGAEFAATYPVVTKAVGSAAVQAALTGELNIERAIVGTVTGVAGAEAGAFVAEAVDSAAAGAIAAAATTAALSGRDIGSAVAKAALFNAGGLMDDDYVYDDRDVLVAEDIELFSGTFTGPAGDVVSITGELVEPPATEWANGYYVDSTGAVRDITNRIVIPAAEADKLTDGEIGDRLFNDWMVQQATVVATQPGDAARPATIRQTAPQTKVPTITDAAKTFDSLLKTGTSIAASVRSIVTGKPPGYATSATGRTTPPVVGVPVRRPDGSIVTNVGNGMQRIQYPDGRVETVSSAAPGGALLPGLSNQTLLIGGAILVGALLLARRK